MFKKVIQNLVQLLYNKCNLQERQLYFLMIGLNFGMQMNAYIGIPLWFEEPIFQCMGENGQRYQCIQMEACKNKDFIVDYEKSGKSLSLHYGLYCEGIEKFQKTVLFCQLSSLIGGFLMMILQMSRIIRLRLFALCTLGNGIFMQMVVFVPYILVNFDNDVQINAVMVLFSLYFFCQGVCGASYNVILAEIFHKDFAVLGNVFGSFMQGIICISIPIIGYLSHGTWQVYLTFISIPMALSGLYGLIVTVNRNPNSLAKQSVVHSNKIKVNIKQYFTNTVVNNNNQTGAYISSFQQSVNLISFLVIMITYIMVHFTIDLQLQQVGGNIYINFILGGFMIVLSCFGVVYLKQVVENYHKMNSIVILINCIIIGSFNFAPLDLITSSFLQQSIFVSLMIFLIFSLEINGIFFYIEVNNFIRVQKIQMFFSLYLVISRIGLSLCTYITLYYAQVTQRFSLSVFFVPYLIVLFVHIFVIKKDPQCLIDVQQELSQISDFIQKSFFSITRQNWSYVEFVNQSAYQTCQSQIQIELQKNKEITETLIQ